MPNDTMPLDQLKSVAAQVGQHMHKLHTLDPFLMRADTVELADSFPLCFLPYEGELTQVGFWHQLHFDGQAAAYAHSTTGSDGQPVIVAVGVSATVRKIATALDWIHTIIKDSETVALVHVPFIHLYAFWLRSANDRFVPIDVFDKNDALQRMRIYGRDDFAAAARSLAPRPLGPPLP